MDGGYGGEDNELEESTNYLFQNHRRCSLRAKENRNNAKEEKKKLSKDRKKKAKAMEAEAEKTVITQHTRMLM